MRTIAQLHHAALAGLLALSLTLPALAQDVHVNPETSNRRSPSTPPTWTTTIPTAYSGATRTCTRPTPQTPA